MTILIGKVLAGKACPKYSFFVKVDETPTFLCSEAAGTEIDAIESTDVYAGEVSGEGRRLAYTGSRSDSVIIGTPPEYLELVGVRDIKNPRIRTRAM